jgi:hypothetical protein
MISTYPNPAVHPVRTNTIWILKPLPAAVVGANTRVAFRSGNSEAVARRFLLPLDLLISEEACAFKLIRVEDPNCLCYPENVPPYNRYDGLLGRVRSCGLLPVVLL